MTSELIINGFLIVALVGAGMVLASILYRLVAWIARVPIDVAASKEWRRSDSTGISFGIPLLRPGLILLVTGSAAAFLVDLLA